MIIVDNPKIKFIKEEDRKPGISAFMRIKNGEDYLMESIMSVINQVDEIICVFNDSTDKTEDILMYLSDKYPSKVKVYKYIPIVYPPNSDKYLKTPPDSPNSLVYYYNYTMSLTTHEYLFKFDDDEIFFPGIIKSNMDLIISDNRLAVPMRGINLYDLDNKLYINNKNKKTVGGDTLLFKYNSSCFFIKNEKFEIFESNLIKLPIVDTFYHTKRCKLDRGIDNYELVENRNSRYYKMNVEMFENIDLIDFYTSDIYKEINIDPHEIGFHFLGNKEYKMPEINELEKRIVGGKFKKNIKKMNKDKALDSIVGISKILKKHGAKHWLTDGTLLGYYRDKDFISHDTDTDIGCMINDLTKELIIDFLNSGFTLGHIFGKMDDGLEIALHHNGIKTDIFFFYEKGDEVYHSAYNNITQYEYTKIDYTYKKFGTKEITFLGHKFFVPDDPLLFIETKYGSDWRIPIKSWRYDTSPKNAINTKIVLNRIECEKEFKIWIGL